MDAKSMPASQIGAHALHGVAKSFLVAALPAADDRMSCELRIVCSQRNHPAPAADTRSSIHDPVDSSANGIARRFGRDSRCRRRTAYDIGKCFREGLDISDRKHASCTTIAG